jgi:hypothetical protein
VLADGVGAPGYLAHAPPGWGSAPSGVRLTAAAASARWRRTARRRPPTAPAHAACGAEQGRGHDRHPLGWQPSRFLADRAEAERAFRLAEQLGSVNAAATRLGTTWPSLRKALQRHGLGMSARNPEAVRQRAIAAASRRAGQPVGPTLAPVFVALNRGQLPAPRGPPPSRACGCAAPASGHDRQPAGTRPTPGRRAVRPRRPPPAPARRPQRPEPTPQPAGLAVCGAGDGSRCPLTRPAPTGPTARLGSAPTWSPTGQAAHLEPWPAAGRASGYPAVRPPNQSPGPYRVSGVD